jgi:hypothetical protein
MPNLATPHQAQDTWSATVTGLSAPTGWPGKYIVNEKGAFQNDTVPDYGADSIFNRIEPIIVGQEIAYAEAIAAFSNIYPGSDAAGFFQHYLNGTGTDRRFDSTVPYHARRRPSRSWSITMRRLMAALLHRLPRGVLKRLHLVVRPDTMLRWHRGVGLPPGAR